jgi:hypothetical protein
VVAAKAALDFAKINYNLSQAALRVPVADVGSYLSIEPDLAAVTSDFDPIVSDLRMGDVNAAAALIPGKLSTDYGTLEAACRSASVAS